ncbi:uncharacterized protein LOC141648443 [Silene latifolia]|uniref:uncharacterized protein LOC141648443 n=1 Tax=Silene latifolia TaxID=37657 RepID=UPI003D772F9D
MVASGLVYISRNGEFVSIHGASLGNGFKKVTIKEVYGGSENALLPVPAGHLEILNDAKGSFVQWPESNIHSPNELAVSNNRGTPKSTKSTQPRSKPLDPTSAYFLGVKVSPEFRQKWRTMSLKKLMIEARVLKTSATMINVDIEEHILHQEQKCMLTYEDLIHWCDEEEISASHIVVFIRYLTELVQTMQCTNSYGFLCPTLLSKFASFENEDNRSDYIVKAMTCTGCESGRKLVFAPYFEGNHWMLVAINPKDSVVYWCDPAGTLEPLKFLKDTINM